MSLIVDAIVACIILVCTLFGYKRGLVKLAFHLCTFFIAIILAYILYKPAATLVTQKTNIDETIQNTIIDKISNFDTSALNNETIQSNDLPFLQNLPDFILKTSENTIQGVAEHISNLLIETGCFIIIFIAANLVLRLLTFLADLVAKLPVLNLINKLGGTLYGVLEGFLIVFIAFAIISVTAPLFDTTILDCINSSNVGSVLYNNNLLLRLIA